MRAHRVLATYLEYYNTHHRMIHLLNESILCCRNYLLTAFLIMIILGQLLLLLVVLDVVLDIR